VKQANTARFVGVYIDQQLHWSKQIKIISMEIAKNIGIINRLALYVP